MKKILSPLFPFMLALKLALLSSILMLANLYANQDDWINIITDSGESEEDGKNTDTSEGSDDSPNEEDDNDCKPEGSDNTCLNFRMAFPLLPRETRIGAQAFQINRNDPSPSLFTPQSLSYTSLALTYVQRITAANQLPAGISHEVYITDRKNVPVRFRVHTGLSIGNPFGQFTSRNLRLQLLDNQKQPVIENPAFYRLLQGNGAYIDYPVSLGSPPSAFRDRNGRHLNLAAMLGDDFRLVLDTGTFRQIRSAAGLADIVVTDDFGYEIRLYTPENTGDFVNGLYHPVGQAYRTVRIENPTGDPNRADQVRIIDTHGAHNRIDLFNYVPAADEWELTEGDGIHRRTEQLLVEHDPATGLEIKTRELRDHQNALVSREVLHIKTFPWNRAVVKKIQDPGGLDLTTTFTYFDNPSQPGRYSRERLVTRPDGSWVRYDYDTEGRRIQKVTPWLDSPTDAEPAAAIETLYDYTPVDPSDTLELFDIRPRTVIIKTLGVETERTYLVYITHPQTGARTTLTERAAFPGAAYGNPANHRTIQTFFSPDDEPVRAGRIQAIRRPDGIYTTYDYQESPEGDWIETNTRDLIDVGGVIVPVDGQSTRATRTLNARNNTISQATSVFAQAEWHSLSLQHSFYTDEISNGRNPLIESHLDGRVLLTQTWQGPNLVERIDEQGLVTAYLHDSLQRVEYQILHPDSPNPITIHYNRTLGAISCGCDGARTVTRSAGGLTLTQSQTTDAAGRMAKQVAENASTTHYIHLDGGRTTTQTNPDGSTVTTERHLDGRTKSVTGTATPTQTYTYGVNPDGSQWTHVTTGDAWQKSTANFLGQTVEQQQPGANNTVLTTTMAYNNKGQLVQTTPPAGASTLYAYDELGQQTMVVQDVENAGLAFFDLIQEEPDPVTGDHPLKGPNRVTESDLSHESDGTDFWRVSRSYTYNHGSATPTLLGTSRQRITGLGTVHPTDPTLGLLVSESLSTDIHGNTSISRRYLNRDTQTTWTEQHSPFSNLPSTTLTIAGLLMESSTPEPATSNSLTSNFDFDSLQRRVGVTDPRTGRSFVTYDPNTGLVLSQTDAAGNITTFTYDTTGRQISLTDPEGNTTHTAYTIRGQVAATWGATYPVVYEYDDQGRMTHLHTLRDPNHSFTPTVSPEGILTSDLLTLTSSMDTTTWIYEESTGLLLQKLHADNKGPSYTYLADGRLLTRTWARETSNQQPPNQQLVTTYTYDPNTLELTQITYSDDTPTVTNEYDRLGRLTKTTDAFGEKSYMLPTALSSYAIPKLRS